jgi:hypothetical protein
MRFTAFLQLKERKTHRSKGFLSIRIYSPSYGKGDMYLQVYLELGVINSQQLT